MMRSLSLTKAQADSLARSLEDAGYISVERKMYTRYSSLIRGDSVFLHHSLGVIRCRLNTVANGIIESIFGQPNGKTPESQDDGQMVSWFFNGYTGKSTTKL
ncbi:hypothetical protein J7X65_003349 [Vibrio parahaemolyticus]|uniref:hypothetical protein n=1 Tax=Vibrio parahaemolyticus TaxID=670 RepID=UPI0005B6D2E5|nr:hypothetical protein [Vibrio parahaemolyticus]KIT55301.1 hypothetical protein H334_03140 [Vibrio parahaemolyticus 901128]EGR3176998.1 hypothetical protein [Vibrio parahaemolyticus]EHH2492660.1 hypothetical protein [Vibrio parahaemolyticus]EIE1222424.1 hypothetical protein [Vibrio parahaemolyticus]EIE1260877.1 hypothetical protein [Vibrio parahaemolyticus]